MTIGGPVPEPGRRSKVSQDRHVVVHAPPIASRTVVTMYYWWLMNWNDGWPWGSSAHPRPVRRNADMDPDHQDRPGTDDVLVGIVADALLDDPRLTGGRIHVRVQNGVAILDGEVDTRRTRAAAAELAASVPGVRDVCTALTVTGKRYGGR